MKKYAGSISFGIVMILVLGWFYINTARADADLPQYIIRKTAGDEEANLKVYGTLNSASNNQWLPIIRGLQITKQGTVYNSGNSEKIDQLAKKYRSFMRGKGWSSNSYYDDKKMLAYVDIDTNEEKTQLQIATLDKKSSKTMTFDKKLTQKADWVEIQHIQKIGSELNFIAKFSQNIDNETEEELVFYKFDLKTKKIVKSKKLNAYNNGDSNQSTYIEFAETNQNKTPYAVFLIVKNAHKELADGSIDSKEISRKYLYCDLKTGEMKEIKSVIAKQKMVVKLVNDHLLYAVANDKDGLRVQPYDIEKQKDLKSYIVKWPLKQADENSVNLKLQHGKLVFYSDDLIGEETAMEKPEIVAVDWKNGKLIFQGEIIPNESMNLRYYNIYGSEIEIK